MVTCNTICRTFLESLGFFCPLNLILEVNVYFELGLVLLGNVIHI